MSETSKPSAPKPERVELRVARLVKAHGLKGGLKLEVYTDDPELRFVPGTSSLSRSRKTHPGLARKSPSPVFAR
jgi:ribosomal 30S subunit maturation factor RimM